MAMFDPGDIIEATAPAITEQGLIAAGDRHTVAQVSASGAFIRLHGAEAYVRASGWRVLERASMILEGPA